MFKEFWLKFKSKHMTERNCRMWNALSFVLFLMIIVTSLAPKEYNIPYKLAMIFKNVK